MTGSSKESKLQKLRRVKDCRPLEKARRLFLQQQANFETTTCIYIERFDVSQ